MTNKVWKKLAEFISYEEKTFGDVVKYMIKYKQPDSADPSKEWTHGAVEADLSDNALDKLISASAGERFCVHQGSDEKGYPVIIDITDAKDAIKEKSAGKKQWNNDKKQWAPKDDSGIAVGAAWTNAIEIIKLSGGFDGAMMKSEEAVQAVAAVAELVLAEKLKQEDKLRASKKKDTEQKQDKKEEEAKPMSRAERLKAEKEAKKQQKDTNTEETEENPNDLMDDDLDDVEF